MLSPNANGQNPEGQKPWSFLRYDSRRYPTIDLFIGGVVQYGAQQRNNDVYLQVQIRGCPYVFGCQCACINDNIMHHTKFLTDIYCFRARSS